MVHLRPDRGFVEGGFAFRLRQSDPGFDVLSEILRVTRHAGEAAGAPGIEPGQPEEVHARHRSDASHVNRLAAAVEHWQIDPAVVGAKANAPHN